MQAQALWLLAGSGAFNTGGIAILLGHPRVLFVSRVCIKGLTDRMFTIGA